MPFLVIVGITALPIRRLYIVTPEQQGLELLPRQTPRLCLVIRGPTGGCPGIRKFVVVVVVVVVVLLQDTMVLMRRRGDGGKGRDCGWRMTGDEWRLLEQGQDTVQEEPHRGLPHSHPFAGIFSRLEEC